MNVYGALVVAHVLTAILGAGQVSALALLARSARMAEEAPGTVAARIAPFVRNTRAALLLLFVTGAALDFRSGGTWHHFWWFRGSVGLLVVTGLLIGLARRASLRPGGAARVERNAWLACLTVGLITALMELKPQ